jgi:molybdate transport system ATP-binding protein
MSILDVTIFKNLNSFDLDVSFSLDDMTLGMKGHSGSGKSMTLKCIAGIETPDSGRIVFRDHVLFDSEKKINLRPQERNIGYLFQNYALFDHMTVYDNIETGLKAHKIPKETRRQKVQEMLQLFQIEEISGRFGRNLSGGQRQRVALARLFAYQPDLILLDEPFSALDEDLKDDVMKELREIIKKFQIPCILVSHNQAEIDFLCNQELHIKKGVFV